MCLEQLALERMNIMRVSQHSGREGSARHNDRDFDLSLAPHLIEDKLTENRTWQMPKYKGMTFQEMERAYYHDTYNAAQEAKNERYRAQGHPERCKTTDDLLTGKLTRPEEIILQIGDRNSEVNPDDFTNCINDYFHTLNVWNKEHGKPMQILNMAIHHDEQGGLHAHIRRVWNTTDKDGNLTLGQNKALEAAGVELPEPEKKVSRYNNRKMTFDSWARAQWQEIVKSHGYEIETVPLDNGRKHSRMADYIRQDNERAQKELEDTRQKLKNIEIEKGAAEKGRDSAIEEKNTAERILNESIDQYSKLQERIETAQQELKDIEEAREKAFIERREADEYSCNIREKAQELYKNAENYALSRQKEVDHALETMQQAVTTKRAERVNDEWVSQREQNLKAIHANHTMGLGGVRLSNDEWKELCGAWKDVKVLSEKKRAADEAAENLRKAGERYIKPPQDIAEQLAEADRKNASLKKDLEAMHRQNADLRSQLDEARSTAATHKAELDETGTELERAKKQMKVMDELAPGLKQASSNVLKRSEKLQEPINKVIDQLFDEADSSSQYFIDIANQEDFAKGAGILERLAKQRPDQGLFVYYRKGEWPKNVQESVTHAAVALGFSEKQAAAVSKQYGVGIGTDKVPHVLPHGAIPGSSKVVNAEMAARAAACSAKVNALSSRLASLPSSWKSDGDSVLSHILRGETSVAELGAAMSVARERQEIEDAIAVLEAACSSAMAKAEAAEVFWTY